MAEPGGSSLRPHPLLNRRRSGIHCVAANVNSPPSAWHRVWTQQRLPGRPTGWLNEWMTLSLCQEGVLQNSALSNFFSAWLCCYHCYSPDHQQSHIACAHITLSLPLSPRSWENLVEASATAASPPLSLRSVLVSSSQWLTLTYMNRQTRIPKSIVREVSVQRDYGSCKGPLYLPKATENWVLFLTSNLLFLPTYQVSKKTKERRWGVRAWFQFLPAV